MKAPSTFMFMLRWYFVPFFCGIVMSVCAIMGLLSPKPPVIAGITSLASVLRPVLYMTLVAGPALVLLAWHRAVKLRGR